MGKIRVGFSGWTFAGWRKSFYPSNLVQKKELEFASQQVNSLEINGTFHSLQKPQSFENWYNQTPKDFIFSIKGGQYITHVLRAKECDDALANFFASGILGLGEKLGPILWQFPPNVMLKDQRFEKFLKLLPRDSKQASRLAKKHTSKLDGRSLTKAKGDFPIRHAFEFRHPSFANPEFLELLRKHNAAYVFSHTKEKSTYIEDLTADFVYVRMHGENDKWEKGHPKPILSTLKTKALAWKSGKKTDSKFLIAETTPLTQKRDVFIYFSNEHKERAPFDAMKFLNMVDSKRAAKPPKTA